MAAKPGEISYLLLELFSARLRPDDLFQDTHYQHLVALELPWHDLVDHIDNINLAQARLYLRSLEEQYIQDHINHSLFNLNLHSKADTPAFEPTLYLLGLLYDPYYRRAEFDKNLERLVNQVRACIERQEAPLDELQQACVESADADTLRGLLIPVLASINHVLFKERGLTGGARQLLNVKSHMVQEILSGHRKGIPLSLSCIYLLIARHLSLPIEGVNLPRHFLIKFQTPEFEIFIDPDGKGRVIDRPEILKLLKTLKLPYNPQYLESCTVDVIARRKIANLILLYKRKGPSAKVKFLETLSRDLAV